MVLVPHVACTAFLLTLLCHLRYVHNSLAPTSSQCDRNKGKQVMSSIGYFIA